MKEHKKPQELDRETPDFQVIDKRQFTDIDKIDIRTAPEIKPRYPSYVEELMSRMTETERKFQEKKKQIDEDISKTRSRLEMDFERKLDLEKQKIVLPFLEILDNLQRALNAASQAGTLEHLLEGVQMTASLFLAKLQTLGVEPIPALGQPFDPNLAQAIGTVKVSDAARDGVIVEEVQAGYSMKGQLLRPAQVRVGHFK